MENVSSNMIEVALLFLRIDDSTAQSESFSCPEPSAEARFSRERQ
jgi:hypothetical protein